ncbi:hypothetical protein FQR65_LT17746 [Abscondita terminalis]|nr:hypothetical protein FQR65_LT17746 [Abscondita terminalis]
MQQQRVTGIDKERKILRHNIEQLAVEQQLGVLTYYSLASGFLTGKYKSDMDFNQSARSEGVKKQYWNERGQRIVAALEEVAECLQDNFYCRGISLADRKAFKKVAQALNILLADETVLYVKTRNAHWNIEGSDFHAVHLFFEEQYNRLSETIDDIAERVRSLGHYAVGFGIASRITAAFGSGAATIGVFFEKPATEGKPGTAGWYNSAAFENEAKEAGLYAKSINGDAFSDEVKKEVKDWKFWIEDSQSAGVLAEGSEEQSLILEYGALKLTYPIYRNGTIGKAKDDLEATVPVINDLLKDLHGISYVSVNKALLHNPASGDPVDSSL